MNTRSHKYRYFITYQYLCTPYFMNCEIGLESPIKSYQDIKDITKLIQRNDDKVPEVSTNLDEWPETGWMTGECAKLTNFIKDLFPQKTPAVTRKDGDRIIIVNWILLSSSESENRPSDKEIKKLIVDDLKSNGLIAQEIRNLLLCELRTS